MHARRDERRDVRVEPDAGDIEEQVIAQLSRIDDAAASTRTARSIARAGSNGIPSSRARPLPEPPGMMPSAGAGARFRVARAARARAPLR